MKIAISTDGETVSMHFGRCPHFTLVTIEGNELKSKEKIDNPGHHPGFLPKFLNEKGVNTIIAGGMGQKAVSLFNEFNIKQVLGIRGEIDSVISQILEGTLKGGESICKAGAGQGYGIDKTVCDH